MTAMTFTSDTTQPDDNNNSYNTGYSDGELAAITKLPARRANARASMAEQYDLLYAYGYSDGYLHGTEVNAAHRLRDLLGASKEGNKSSRQ